MEEKTVDFVIDGIITPDTANIQKKNSVRLLGMSGPYLGIDYEIKPPEFVIGRILDCQLVMNDKTISARHARIYYSDNAYIIEDLDSTNGTYVNNEKIFRKKLRTEDIIKIDKHEFRYINDQEVSRTIISTNENFALLSKDKNAAPNSAQVKNIEKSSKHQEKPAIEKPAIPDKIQAAAKTNFWPGWLLALIVSYAFNYGLILLINSASINNISWLQVKAVFKVMVMSFPFYHMHDAWLNGDWSLSAAAIRIIIPLGLLITGIFLQRTAQGNRFINSICFSVSYCLIAILMQLAMIGFNFNLWLNMNKISWFIDNPAIVNIVINLTYFTTSTFIFCLLGTFFIRKSNS
jgi:hypothetical protein